MPSIGGEGGGGGVRMKNGMNKMSAGIMRDAEADSFIPTVCFAD